MNGIIVVGEREFGEGDGSFQSLADHFRNIRLPFEVINAVGMSRQEFVRALCTALENARCGTGLLVIAYLGHGYHGGWAFSSEGCVSYRKVVSLLEVVRRPLFILNDCCYSGRLIGKVRHRLWGVFRHWQTPVGIIASGHGETFEFMTQAISSWRSCKAYDAREYPYCVAANDAATEGVLHYSERPRWGEQFDYCLFPA